MLRKHKRIAALTVGGALSLSGWLAVRAADEVVIEQRSSGAETMFEAIANALRNQSEAKAIRAQTGPEVWLKPVSGSRHVPAPIAQPRHVAPKSRRSTASESASETPQSTVSENRPATATSDTLPRRSETEATSSPSAASVRTVIADEPPASSIDDQRVKVPPRQEAPPQPRPQAPRQVENAPQSDSASKAPVAPSRDAAASADRQMQTLERSREIVRDRYRMLREGRQPTVYGQSAGSDRRTDVRRDPRPENAESVAAVPNLPSAPNASETASESTIPIDVPKLVIELPDFTDIPATSEPPVAQLNDAAFSKELIRSLKFESARHKPAPNAYPVPETVGLLAEDEIGRFFAYISAKRQTIDDSAAVAKTEGATTKGDSAADVQTVEMRTIAAIEPRADDESTRKIPTAKKRLQRVATELEKTEELQMAFAQAVRGAALTGPAPAPEGERPSLDIASAKRTQIQRHSESVAAQTVRPDATPAISENKVQPPPPAEISRINPEVTKASHTENEDVKAPERFLSILPVPATAASADVSTPSDPAEKDRVTSDVEAAHVPEVAESPEIAQVAEDATAETASLDPQPDAARQGDPQQRETTVESSTPKDERQATVDTWHYKHRPGPYSSVRAGGLGRRWLPSIGSRKPAAGPSIASRGTGFATERSIADGVSSEAKPERRSTAKAVADDAFKDEVGAFSMSLPELPPAIEDVEKEAKIASKQPVEVIGTAEPSTSPQVSRPDELVIAEPTTHGARDAAMNSDDRKQPAAVIPPAVSERNAAPEPRRFSEPITDATAYEQPPTVIPPAVSERNVAPEPRRFSEPLSDATAYGQSTAMERSVEPETESEPIHPARYEPFGQARATDAAPPVRMPSVAGASAQRTPAAAPMPNPPVHDLAVIESCSKVLLFSSMEPDRREAMAVLANTAGWHRHPLAVNALIRVTLTDYQTQMRRTAIELLCSMPAPQGPVVETLKLSSQFDADEEIRAKAAAATQRFTAVQ